MRPEDDLLLCCSRVNIDSERAEKIKIILQSDVDWPYLIQMALRHGLIPLLYRNLKMTCLHRVPERIFNRLRNYFLLNASRNLLLNEELFKLLHLFETEGISAIPYKGPTLAASIYGDVALRQFSDLDILIQKQDVMRAQDFIVASGYQPHFQLNNSNIKPYLKSQNELSFTRQDGRVTVELQWEIAPRYFNFSIPSRFMWENVENASKTVPGFRTLSPEIELIILCVHGAKDLWTRLLWICDVAELVRINKALDWDRVIRLSSTLGSARILFLGLFLAKNLLDASLPDGVTQRIESDPRIRRLANQVRDRLFNGSNSSSGILKNSLFYLKARERLRDRIQYCFRLVTTTTVGDWDILPLPKPLFLLYYLIRPIRLAAKYWQKPLWGRLQSLKVNKIFNV